MHWRAAPLRMLRLINGVGDGCLVADGGLRFQFCSYLYTMPQYRVYVGIVEAAEEVGRWWVLH